MQHGRFDFKENQPRTMEELGQANKALKYLIQEKKPFSIRVNPETMRLFGKYPSVTLEEDNEYYFAGIPVLIDPYADEFKLEYPHQQELDDYIETLRKIAYRYDEKQGGRISEHQMRMLAADVLKKHHHAVFVEISNVLLKESEVESDVTD